MIRSPKALLASFVLIVGLSACAPKPFDLGLTAFEAEDYPTAYEQWVIADTDDDASAQNGIGWIIEKGLINPANPKQAITWYQKAAEQGHDGAYLNLGNLYDNGVGIDKDYQMAAQYFEKAAKKGNPVAQNNLGRMYQQGQGVPEDQKKATTWLKRAARQGYAPAQNSLGLQYFKGWGITQNAEEALFWLEVATLSGQEGAEHNRNFVRTFLDEKQIVRIEKRASFWRPQ